MKIFSDEFRNWFNRNFICRFKGHEKSGWMEEQWAIGHSTGCQVKMCLRCNEELDRIGKSYAERI